MNSPLEIYQAQIEAYGRKVAEYAARLHGSAEDYARVLPRIPPGALAALDSPYTESRRRMAEARLRMDLRGELLHAGVGVASEEQVDALLAAIPRGDYSRLIAARY